MAITSSFHWSGSFSNADSETAYRTYRLGTDRKLISVTCVILVLAVCGYLLNDLRHPDVDNPSWRILLAGRMAIVIFAILYTSMLHRVDNPRMLDALTLVITLAVVFSSLWANGYRPKEFYTHVGADVVILIGIYLIIPLSQTLRFGIAAAYSAGLAYLYFVYKTPPDAMTETSVAVSLTIANLCGVLISLRHARTQRSEYTALTNEQAARQALEQAQSEIRSLSGLIPICASCKSVRNDEGYWEQVENYVRDRSEAQFSHGLCPECEKNFTL